MPTQVLVVDDSAFFRRRIKEILEQHVDLKVVGFADNGRQAITEAKRLAPDVITMDYEMPMLDGISAVKAIMEECPTPILMFSSLSYDGARVTLDALEAGALDYLPKSFEAMSTSADQSAQILQERVIALARRKRFVTAAKFSGKPSSQTTAKAVPSNTAPSPYSTDAKAISPKVNVTNSLASSRSKKIWQGEHPALVIIGASTGGPVVLQQLLTQLPVDFPAPILLVQHMPRTFTAAFAERLDRLCRISVKEAADQDVLKPGTALLAPGGLQMLVDAGGRKVSIIEGNDRVQYRPSVDVTFGSAARSVSGKVLAIVLTGMGHDGREGSRLLKQKGAVIWTQDENSCVVYGMPMAVVTAGLSDRAMTVDEIGRCLSEI